MRKLFLFLWGVLLFAAQAIAQRSITGKVTDEKGNPLPNVSVLAKGTVTGTVTKDDGTYALRVPENAKALVFSSVDMTPVELAIGTQSVINATLKAEEKSLAEVVLMGYGAVRKSNLTASVSKAGADKFENKPFTSLDQMLQGAAPGLQATSTTGQPGAVTPIRIRGIGSFSYSGSGPLYIIDGVQINSGDLANGNSGAFNINPSTNVLATLNSDDIESVFVLKDAAAISIYGSRGANGVIIINTKSGKAGKTQFRFDTEIGSNKVILPPPNGLPLRADNWFVLLKEGLINSGASATSINTTLASYGYGNGVDVDWYGLITRPGSQQQYNLSASGGDAKTKFFFSGGYFKQEGTTIGTDLKRYNANIRIMHNINNKLSFNTKLTVGDVVQNSALASNGPYGGGGFFGNPAYVSLVLRPTQNPYKADGSLNIGTDNLSFPAHYNPLFIAANDKRWLKAFSGLGNEIVEYKILKGLKYTGTLGLQYNTEEEYQYNNPFHGDASSSAIVGEGISIYTRNFLWDLINQLDYHYDIIKKQNFYIDLKAGYEAIRNYRYQQIGDVSNFPPRSDLYYSTAAATSTNGKASASDYSFAGIYSNANLSFRDKYSLYGSFRRDGSSRFGTIDPYANFYSVGASWNVTKEDFFEKLNIDKIISVLKLRGSYGTSGNSEIGNYTWRPEYSFGYNYNGISGGTFDNIGNIGLTWEKNKQTDVGIDVSLWKNRINITLDQYKRITEGSLFNEPLSRTTGFEFFINNVANLENTGTELSLNIIPIKIKDLTWELNFSYTHNKNKVTQLPNGNADILNGSYLLRIGEDFYSFYTRAWAGVDPANGSPLWYTDSTKKSTTSNFNNAKLFLVDKSATPKYFGTLGTTINFKGFSASADFYYNYGNYFQETYYRFFADGFSPTRGKYTFNLNRWQKPGDITDVPKYVYGTTNNSYTGSDRTLFKGDYIRLRNVQIGYTLSNKDILSKLHINGLYFYVRGINLWTHTIADNLVSDPEQGILGVNNQQVLPQKSTTVGLNVNF
jgi:TonB-dependent starch-binding outer membrane protein SusC